MTYRDRLRRDHPEYVDDDIYIGGCKACPWSYGYEDVPDTCYLQKDMDKECKRCWDREMEGAGHEPERIQRREE